MSKGNSNQLQYPSENHLLYQIVSGKLLIGVPAEYEINIEPISSAIECLEDESQKLVKILINDLKLSSYLRNGIENEVNVQILNKVVKIKKIKKEIRQDDIQSSTG